MRFMNVSTGRESNPYRGIIVAVALAAALLIVILSVRHIWAPPAQRPETGAPPAVPEPEDAFPSQPQAQVEEQQAPKPTPEPSQEPSAKLPSYLTDPQILEKTTYSATLDNYPFYHLLYQMKIAELDELARDAVPAPPPAEIERLKRGAPVTLEGTVVALIPRKDLAIPDVDIKGATQYEIKTGDGNVYLVFTVYMMSGVSEGDEVKVLGRYLRLYQYASHEYAQEGQEERELPTPVIIAREVDGSKYASDPSVLGEVSDETFSYEAKAFYYLANLVRGLSPEEIRSRVDETVSLEAIHQAPAAERGKFVIVEGFVIRAQTVDDTPNIANIGRMYRTILRSSEGPPLWVFTFEDPRSLDVGEGVRVHGVFFKRLYYQNKQGYEFSAYLVVARRLDRIEYKENPYFAILTLAGGTVLIIALVIAVIMERRTSRKVAQHVRELSARARPRNLNDVAREIAAKTRKAGEQPGEPHGKDNTPAGGGVA